MGKDYKINAPCQGKPPWKSIPLYSLIHVHIYTRMHTETDSQVFMFDYAMKATIYDFSKPITCTSVISYLP